MRVPVRHYPGPTAELVEENDPGDPGAPHTLTVVLADRYRKLESLRFAMEIGASFMSAPMVPGVAAMLAADPERGRYTYLTGEVWSLAELLDDARRRREPLGPRAAAEIGWLAGHALVEAADAALAAGIGCHGDVSPWRIVVSADGSVQLIGYGLAEPEALRVRQTEGDPKEPVFGYAPPERVARRIEDVRSDLFSLAVVLAEVAVGEPLLSGDPVSLRESARAGGASRALQAMNHPDQMPPALKQHLLAALAAARERRMGDDDAAPSRWCQAFDLLLDAPGRSLSEITAEAALRRDQSAGRGATTPIRQAHETEQVRNLPELLARLGEPAPSEPEAAGPAGVRDRVRSMAGARREGPRPRRFGDDPMRADASRPSTIAPRTAGTSQPAPMRITPASAAPVDTTATPIRAMDDPRRRSFPEANAAHGSDTPRRAAPAADDALPRRASADRLAPREDLSAAAPQVDGPEQAASDRPRRAPAIAPAPSAPAGPAARTPDPISQAGPSTQPASTTDPAGSPSPTPPAASLGSTRAHPVAPPPSPGPATPPTSPAAQAGPPAPTPLRAQPAAQASPPAPTPLRASPTQAPAAPTSPPDPRAPSTPGGHAAAPDPRAPAAPQPPPAVAPSAPAAPDPRAPAAPQPPPGVAPGSELAAPPPRPPSAPATTPPAPSPDLPRRAPPTDGPLPRRAPPAGAPPPAAPVAAAPPAPEPIAPPAAEPSAPPELDDDERTDPGARADVPRRALPPRAGRPPPRGDGRT
jgi:hypothetical protein